MTRFTQSVGAKVGVDPALIAGLVVALIQAAATCIKPSPDVEIEKSKISPQELFSYLNGNDAILGTRWIVKRIRRNYLANQISMHCAVTAAIPNEKTDSIKSELFKEIDSLTCERLEVIMKESLEEKEHHDSAL